MVGLRCSHAASRPAATRNRQNSCERGSCRKRERATSVPWQQCACQPARRGRPHCLPLRKRSVQGPSGHRAMPKRSHMATRRTSSERISPRSDGQRNRAALAPQPLQVSRRAAPSSLAAASQAVRAVERSWRPRSRWSLWRGSRQTSSHAGVTAKGSAMEAPPALNSDAARCSACPRESAGACGRSAGRRHPQTRETGP